MVKAAKPEPGRSSRPASKTTPARGAKAAVQAAPAKAKPAPKRAAGAAAGVKTGKAAVAAKPATQARGKGPGPTGAKAAAPSRSAKPQPSAQAPRHTASAKSATAAKAKPTAAAPKPVSRATPVPATLPPAKPSKPVTAVVPSRPMAIASTTAPKSMSSIAPAAPAPTKADPKLANAWKTKSPQELTDAEVLAMPESEYMKATQLEFFKHRLSTLRDELLRSAGETTEHLREDTLLVPDPADRATIEEEHALELRARDRERKLLKKVEQAIALIDAGEYGWCEETGEPIGIGRLLARPTATLSLEAQQRREMKQKMFGD